MPDSIKIGTRDSALALWQARFVQAKLGHYGVASELVAIKSDGEMDPVSPLYEMGVQGIFTRTLDIALLQGKVDIVVHSLKDVPTQLPKGLSLAAVPKRGPHADVLVYKKNLPEAGVPFLVATSSLRRSAQWKYRFPEHEITVLRGNINTRLRKLLEAEHWGGALFAAAGIERIDLPVPHIQALDWMIPAPAQGALGVVCREQDAAVFEKCRLLNHEPSAFATSIERAFLRRLMGGCSMPIGAYARMDGGELAFSGCVLTLDGKKMACVEFRDAAPGVQVQDIVNRAVAQLLDQGGGAILETFKSA
jgi:hydroxymethylbilane synthase